MNAHAGLWLIAAGAVLVYASLPDGDDELAPAPPAEARAADVTGRLAIVEVVPREAASGSAIALSYTGATPGAALQVSLGKRPLRVLSERTGTLVAELPAGLVPGSAKLRLASGGERSKSYELKIKAADWRKPFRNLLGGWVLLVLGVRRLARAARSVSSLSSSRWPAHSVWKWAAASAGTLLGALLQSTTAAAGLLAGGVSSRRLGVQPAAACFLGAQVGAAAAPLLFHGATEPHVGLLIVGVGGLVQNFSTSRSARAWAWLVLAAGLVAFSVQLLRPSFGPFASDPQLLVVLDRVAPRGVLGSLSRVLLGASLVALFQGPAPVLVLASAIAQLMGHAHPRDTLLLLSGAGLGSALAALLTTSGGARCRALTELNLLLGLCNTALTAATVDVWTLLARRLSDQASPLHWSAQLLPAGGFESALAFALSQLAAAALLLPLVSHAHRLLEWRRRAHARRAAERGTPAPLQQLSAVLDVQGRAVPNLLRLALHGERAAGSEAHAYLREADRKLHELCVEPAGACGTDPALLRLGCLQLQRTLESVLWNAEQLTDERVVSSAPALPDCAVAGLRELHALLAEGLASLREHVHSGSAPDPERTREREIEINVLDAELRRLLSVTAVEPRDLGVVRLVDALETSGNQLYRLAESLAPRELLEPAKLTR